MLNDTTKTADQRVVSSTAVATLRLPQHDLHTIIAARAIATAAECETQEGKPTFPDDNTSPE
jgi:hypothetical protein